MTITYTEDELIALVKQDLYDKGLTVGDCAVYFTVDIDQYCRNRPTNNLQGVVIIK